MNLVQWENIILFFQVKAQAQVQLFDTAPVIVNSTTDKYQEPEQPDGSRPSYEGLLKICNRTRQ